MARVDVHQHLWPAELVEALRERSRPPYLDGWTLHTGTEAPYDVAPADHDPTARRRLDAADGNVAEVLLGLSSPLGIEHLDTEEAEPLLKAWHAGVAALGGHWRAWAATTVRDPDLDALDAALADDRIVGLQVPATAMLFPDALERIAPTLARAESAGRPVLVHPGPAVPTEGAPAWWPAVVDYVAQLQASWWAWSEAGRELLPTLRICFVAGAGLAPTLHERFTARGGGRLALDHETFVETSSLGRQALDSLVRVLGVDVVCLGSDRPYAEPIGPSAHGLGDAAERALTTANPARLLTGRWADPTQRSTNARNGGPR